MRLARHSALLLFIAAALGALLVALSGLGREQTPAARPPERRPTLLFVSSLPLLFGEGFSLQSSGSPAIKRLQTRYRLVPISVTDPEELRKGRLLLMAQPQAQTAENLVALDRWVRGGGRLLLLADPLLEWPSSQSLGDLTRPPAVFMDTGLLLHWGLSLDGPDKPGAERRRLGGYTIMTSSPGSLRGHCRVSPDGFVAHCRIGQGTATIVADADFLDIGRLGREARHNLDGLLAELASLEQP